MARRLRAGYSCDYAGNAQMRELTTATSSVTFSGGAIVVPKTAGQNFALRRGVGFSPPADTGANRYETAFFTVNDDVGAGNTEDIVVLASFGASDFISVRIQRVDATHYNIGLYEDPIVGSVQSAFGSTSLVVGTEYRLRLRKINSTGVLTLEVNETEEVSSFTPVTGWSYDAYVFGCRQGNAGSSWRIPCRWDCDSGADRPLDSGSAARFTLASGAGRYSDFTSGSGTNPSYLDQDDWEGGGANDGETTRDGFGLSNNVTKRQTYQTTAPTVTNAVEGVRVCSAYRGGVLGKTANIKALISDGSADAESGNHAYASDSYHVDWFMFTTAPDGSTFTQADDLDPLEIGLRVDIPAGDDNFVAVSAMWAEVFYDVDTDAEAASTIRAQPQFI